jgi:hypothetical protein
MVDIALECRCELDRLAFFDRFVISGNRPDGIYVDLPVQVQRLGGRTAASVGRGLAES